MNKVIPMLIAAALFLGGGNSAMADACDDILATYAKKAAEIAAGWEELKEGRKERDALHGKVPFDREKYDLLNAKQNCAQAQYTLHTSSAHNILGKAVMKVCGKRAVFGCGAHKACRAWFDSSDAEHAEEEKKACAEYEELNKK